MTGHAHHHHHHHGSAGLPLSVMAQSALVRLAFVIGVLAFLWLAILWAVALP